MQIYGLAALPLIITRLRELHFFIRCKEQVCVFVATKTSRMPTAPGKLAFCARWLQKEQSAEKSRS